MRIMFSTKWLVLFSLWAARLVRQPTAPVSVSSGLVQGVVAPDGWHAEYLGIPYATVVGRFQPPQPEPKWDGIFNAYNEHMRCIQRYTSTRVLGKEDCLTLNVYTPIGTENKLLPVMVFIHGGGFRDGSSTPFIYGPKYLITHDVILVTFNYRLEVLGFLCLGIKQAPGNAGLKDQVEALKWVRRNIKAFGGDPENVTIFGESAGSASVVYHLVSPMSKELFHKAIMQSGSAMSPWSLQFEPLKTAMMLAQQLGYNTTNPYEIYNIFKNATAEDLLMHRVPRKEGDIVLSENIFVPCIEEEIQNVERFLPDAPFNLISKGHYHKVPVIIGYNNAEGYMFIGKENETTLSRMNFEAALPRDLVFPSKAEKTQVANKLRELYMGDDVISKDTQLKFSRYEGDSSIVFPTIATVDLLLKTSTKHIYVYKFCYDGWLNFAKFLFGFRNAPGATHADELFYIFNIEVSLLPLSIKERDTIEKMTTLWTNFAKYSDPTPISKSLLQWQPADHKNPRLLEINKRCKMAPIWDDTIIRFWNTTYSKYRRKG